MEKKALYFLIWYFSCLNINYVYSVPKTTVRKNIYFSKNMNEEKKYIVEFNSTSINLQKIVV